MTTGEKISQLAAANTLDGTESLPVVQTGQTDTVKATTSNVAALHAGPVYNVKTYGAKGNGTTDDTAAISSAITAAKAAGGGTVYLPPGTYKITSTLTTIDEKTSFVGAGSMVTLLSHTGNGDCLRVTMASFNTTKPQAGQIAGFELIGNSGGSACGIHMGDIVGLRIDDVYIRDYTAGTGLWQDNQQATNGGSSERTLITKTAFKNCAKAIRQTVNGGSTSFDYQRWLDVRFELNATGQIGISTEGSAQMLRAFVRLVANVNASGSSTAVWSVTGGAQVDQCTVHFDVEQTTGSGASGLIVDGTSTFRFFSDSHMNFAGLLWLVTGTYGLTTDAQLGIQTHTYTSGTLTVAADIARAHEITVTANMSAALVVSHPAVGQDLRLTFIQDGTGGRTVLYPSNCVFANGYPPACSNPNSRVTIDFNFDGTNWNETSRSPVAGHLALGFAFTMPPYAGTTAGSVGANNRAYYMRAQGQARQVSALLIAVGNQSGNVCVGVYRNTGSGSSAAPGARKSTSGSVVCPSVGANTVSISPTIDIEEGDWLAISCDNTTATFVHGDSVIPAGGWNMYQETAFPLPSTATPAGNPGYPIYLQSA